MKDTSLDEMMNAETLKVMSETLDTVCSSFPIYGAFFQCKDCVQTNAQETLIATFEKFTGMEETTTEPMLFEEFISQKVEHHPT